MHLLCHAYCQSTVNSVSWLADKNDWTEKSANQTAELETDYGYYNWDSGRRTVRAHGFVEPQSPPLYSQNPIPIPNFFYLEIHLKSALYPTINLLTSIYFNSTEQSFWFPCIYIIIFFCYLRSNIRKIRYCQVMFWRTVPFISCPRQD